MKRELHSGDARSRSRHERNGRSPGHHSTFPYPRWTAAMSPSPTPESRMHGCSAHRRSYLPSADHQWGDVQEQGDALQPGRPYRLLRRIDVRGADCLGPPLRARRRLSHHLLQLGHPRRRRGRARIRDHRRRPHHSVMAPAGGRGAPVRLPLHHPASLLRPATRHSPQGVRRHSGSGRHRPAGPPLLGCARAA